MVKGSNWSRIQYLANLMTDMEIRLNEEIINPQVDSNEIQEYYKGCISGIKEELEELS